MAEWGLISHNFKSYAWSVENTHVQNKMRSFKKTYARKKKKYARLNFKSQQLVNYFLLSYCS